MKTLIALGALVIGGLWGLSYGASVWWCGMKASDMGVSHKHTIVSGCLMSVDEKVWVPDDRFRITETTGE